LFFITLPVGDICQLTLHDTACTPETWDTLTNNWTTANGDPKFTSTDLSDATSATLPNLSLQSNSTALNGGTYLTQANGSGNNSSTLIVDDALYFQDGSWGSDLNRGINFFPDWIAIGNVNNVVQISSIDYSTNTITLASNATWSDNDPVWLYKKSDGTRVLYESAPEYGAHEYNVSTVAPTVTTSQPNNVSNSSITLNANISALGGEASTNKGFAYGTASDLSTVIATTSLGVQTETGAFSQSITGLSGNTTYYFRAYAVNSAGTSTGSILSTTTSLDPTPTPTATPAPSGGGGGGGGGGSSGGDFDGTLGPDYVKIISPNRVLSKMDIVQVIDAIKKNKSLFTAKTVSKQKEAIFENKVIVICSGAELDVRDFTKKENNTGVAIEIRDIQIDKKELDFKKPTEASILYSTKGNTLTIDVKDYYSPLLMKRLELENEGRLSAKERVNVFDYRQAIEHIVIDVNYGEGQKKSKDIAFNAEAFLHKAKKNELVDVSYTHTYEKKGTYTVAVKIVDVLGEEYFETHEVTIK
jgi:hypothetical protein